jgi:hypothetical protein
MTPKTHIWNGTPIEYREHVLTPHQGVTLVPCIDYLWPDGALRYVAIRDGEIIAVEFARCGGFCNMVCNSLWKGESLRAYFPDYARRNGVQTYDIPFVRATQEAK